MPVLTPFQKPSVTQENVRVLAHGQRKAKPAVPSAVSHPHLPRSSAVRGHRLFCFVFFFLFLPPFTLNHPRCCFFSPLAAPLHLSSNSALSLFYRTSPQPVLCFPAPIKEPRSPSFQPRFATVGNLFYSRCLFSLSVLPVCVVLIPLLYFCGQEHSSADENPFTVLGVASI